jgi:hypothetical protein
MARFSEVFRCSGVDESPNVPGKSKVPGMVIPTDGWNIVALEDGERLRVHSENKHIKIEEIGDTAVIKLARLYLNFKLAGQDVDSQFRDSYMPHILSSKARFFKIHGKALVGAPGAVVQASSGRKVEAKLRVVVFDLMKIKLAIGNVTVPNENGRPVYHADKPCDPQKECDQMNAIWTPQTQMAFDLISSDPIFLDDREKSIREDIGQALGIRAKEGSFPENVDTGKLRNVFSKLKNKKADLTIFVVQKIQMKTTLPNGWTDGESGFCVLAGSHGPSTAAHEAGHFLFGGRGKDGKWDSLHHPWPDNDPDKTPLMRDGGAGFKIQFDLALQARTFFDRHR